MTPIFTKEKHVELSKRYPDLYLVAQNNPNSPLFNLDLNNSKLPSTDSANETPSRLTKTLQLENSTEKLLPVPQKRIMNDDAYLRKQDKIMPEGIFKTGPQSVDKISSSTHEPVKISKKVTARPKRRILPDNVFSVKLGLYY